MRTSSGISHSPRFNPFNDDKGLFSDIDDDSRVPSSGSELTSTTSEGSADVSLAELGLTEDYFAQPDGGLGMSSSEELEAAIENCKKMILELPEDSVRRKKFVSKLVQLRMKFLELKEGPTEFEPRVKQVLGHKLRKRKSNSIKYYCDCCNGLIWGVLQAWYRCKECGFNCHNKCVNMIRRKCVAIDMNNLPYNLDISPEIGLSSQQFNCAECKNPISVTGMGKEEARICDYNGQYYCPQCHWNDTSVIPGRVVHNWDFTPQKVSRQSYQILSKLYKRPLLNLQEINPLLFNYVEELADIRKLREDILLMKVYFVTCSNALDLKLLLKLSDRQHFVDCSDKYSMEDLVEAQSGTLTEYLTNLHAEYAKHIKLDCLVCQAKGFICEICNSGETLFPFDFGVSTCTKCHAVFHRDCFTCIDTLCPRCERFQKKKKLRKNKENALFESDESYESEGSYLRSGELSSSTELPTTSKPVARYSPAFTTTTSDKASIENTDNTRDRNDSKSSAIQIDPYLTEKRSRESSFHSLLTDSSYTDYAVLGFAGAGRSKNPASENNQNIEHTEIEKTEKSLDSTVKLVTKNGKINHPRQPRYRFHQNEANTFNYETNPVTRRPQRDDNLFNDLVKSKTNRPKPDPNRETKIGRNRTSQEPAAAQHSAREKTNDQRINQKYNLRSGRHYDPTLDPFHNHENPSTRFMSDVAKSKFHSDLSPSDQPELDPFNQNRNKGSKFIDRVTPSTSYRPELDPFHQNEDKKTKFMKNVTPRNFSVQNTTRGFHDQRNQNHVARFRSDHKQWPIHDSAGNPFDTNDSASPFNKSGNPFDDADHYDDAKNPFS
uniref:differentially expressed in FDCP 8-like n=1 Tax=Styela clava TaxID=7725 RepID=UPI00193962B1|nr:differentially expressed in FDCP 8-like [Styela clava]